MDEFDLEQHKELENFYAKSPQKEGGKVFSNINKRIDLDYISEVIDKIDLDDEKETGGWKQPPSDRYYFQDIENEYAEPTSHSTLEQHELDREILEIEKRKLELQLELVKKKMESARLSKRGSQSNRRPHTTRGREQEPQQVYQNPKSDRGFNSLGKSFNSKKSFGKIDEDDNEYNSESKADSVGKANSGNEVPNDLTLPLDLDFQTLSKEKEAPGLDKGEGDKQDELAKEELERIRSFYKGDAEQVYDTSDMKKKEEASIIPVSPKKEDKQLEG